MIEPPIIEIKGWELTPSVLAQWFMTRTLREITALQIALAQEGIMLEIHTAEVFSVEQPSLGKE